MPAKRIIILDRSTISETAYRAVLWADVPAGNQIAKVNPSASSAYENIAPAELQAIRDGLVVEKVVTYSADAGAPVALWRAALVGLWTAWQAQVTAEAAWVEYGSYYNDSGVWQATTGVPMYSVKESPEGLPTFSVLVGLSSYGANKFHLVLYNGVPTSTSQGLLVKIRLLVVLPGTTAVTGAVSGPWSMRRREWLTTAPAGTGGLTLVPHDSAQALPTGIGAWNAPQTAPAGGTVSVIWQGIPQADEQKVTTLDAPTMASLQPFGGLTLYSADKLRSARPLVIRPGQTLEVQQDGTSGTGNCRLLCLFTVG